MIKISFAAKRPAGAYALAIPVKSEDAIADRVTGLDEATSALALRSAEAQHFERGIGAICESFVVEGTVIRRLLLVGLGAQAVNEESAYEQIGGALTARLFVSGETRLVVDLEGLGLDAHEAALIAFGAAARSWRYDLYRTKLSRKDSPTLEELVIVGAAKGVHKHWAHLAAVLEGLDLTRTLVTEPPNVIYPETFVERCREAMDGVGVEFTILDQKAMAKLGMGALLGVGQGSARPPRLLAMRWNGGKKARPVVVVGKGITFDAGGISIKPALGMDAMKWDMGGAGAVAGLIRTLATRKAKVNVVGVCALAENMPDGNAQRPGDIVTSMSGQTIEVIDTDSEGRLVLADAMTWAQREYDPEIVIDIATLTGAIIITLAHEIAGLFSNNDALAERLLAAARSSGDHLWRLPMGDSYNRLMDSPVADMKNQASQEGGSITAACFLQRFVEEGVKWAHIDIAGMAWSDKATHLYDKGATGFGVALLNRYLADNHEN